MIDPRQVELLAAHGEVIVGEEADERLEIVAIAMIVFGDTLRSNVR